MAFPSSQETDSDAGGTPVERWAADRQRYIDTLKVGLVAAVIAAHAVMGYADVDWWSYGDVREVTLATPTVVVLATLAAPVSLFAMPLLFLVAGLLTPQSLMRKGARRFARDRLVRLGVPFVVFAVLIWPLLEYGLLRTLGDAPALAVYFRDEGTLDTGVLWFVGALLAFSLVYAALGQLLRRLDTSGRSIDAGTLAALVGAIAVGSFLVRLRVPYETDTRFIDVNVWEWPACAALFGLGAAAYRQGWLAAVPADIRRTSRRGTLAAVLSLAVFAGAGVVVGASQGDEWAGGWNLAAAGFAAIEAMLTVFGSVWMLAIAQDRLGGRHRWAGPAAARSAYGAFLVQGPILLALAVAVRWVPVPAEAKALFVAVCGVLASFGLVWLLVRRSRIVARVL
jgi:hypothetical protein